MFYLFSTVLTVYNSFQMFLIVCPKNGFKVWHIYFFLNVNFMCFSFQLYLSNINRYKSLKLLDCRTGLLNITPGARHWLLCSMSRLILYSQNKFCVCISASVILLHHLVICHGSKHGNTVIVKSDYISFTIIYSNPKNTVL